MAAGYEGFFRADSVPRSRLARPRPARGLGDGLEGDLEAEQRICGPRQPPAMWASRPWRWAARWINRAICGADLRGVSITASGDESVSRWRLL